MSDELNDLRKENEVIRGMLTEQTECSQRLRCELTHANGLLEIQTEQLEVYRTRFLEGL